MNRRKPIPRSRWVLCGISLMLLAGTIALRLRPVAGADGGQIVSALRAERDALPAVDPAELARGRERQAALAQERWTAESWRQWCERLAPRWRVSEPTGQGPIRVCRVKAEQPEGLNWPEAVSLIAELEKTPGLTVDAVAVTTQGSRRARSFAAVEIHLTLQWAGPGPERPGPPVSPSTDRRPQAQPRSGGSPAAGAGDRARPAALHSAVHFAAGQSLGGSVPGSARLRGRTDHPRLVRVGGHPPGEAKEKPMTTLSVPMPEEVAAVYFDAAEAINRDYGPKEPAVDAKALMAFVLSRYDMHEVCAQFEVALRVIGSRRREPPFNPAVPDAA